MRSQLPSYQNSFSPGDVFMREMGIIGGLSPVRCKAITWRNDDCLAVDRHRIVA